MLIRILLASLPLVLLLGCPKAPPAPADPDPAKFAAAAPIPADSPLISYGKLKLGMSSLDISQAYNAPEGKGEGFTRVIQDFGAAQNQIIAFDEKKGEPSRKMVLRVYRDAVCKLVDRRDHLSAAQADAWFAELKKAYGEEMKETVSGAQWSWGKRGDVLLTFTRDNADPKDMSANVVLVHDPSYEASQNYLAEYEKLHPQDPGKSGTQSPDAAAS